MLRRQALKPKVKSVTTQVNKGWRRKGERKKPRRKGIRT